MEAELMPVLVWRDEMPSDSNPRKTYTVSVYSDGTALCECTAFAIQRNKGNLAYRCKHAQRALDSGDVRDRIARARVARQRVAPIEPAQSSAAATVAQPYEGRRAKIIDL